MMLTGFDAKKVNTLYVDKNPTRFNTGVFKNESNTREQKSQGNILLFRNPKKADE
jgi:type I restriction enzyme R subunit